MKFISTSMKKTPKNKLKRPLRFQERERKQRSKDVRERTESLHAII